MGRVHMGVVGGNVGGGRRIQRWLGALSRIREGRDQTNISQDDLIKIFRMREKCDFAGKNERLRENI